MRKTMFVLVLLGAGIFAPAAAESTKERLLALERSVANLQAAAPSASASALRIGQLEEQIQSLTGRVEQLTYDLDQANAKLAAVTAALSGGAAVAGGPSPGAPTDLGAGDPIADRIVGAAPAIELPADPDAAFDYAASFLMSGDYARAQAAFELYLKAFPNHPRTPDAQFRLGEIYLAQGANADAADAFIAHIKKYPNDPRAPEAYLKLGSAFARMQQNAEACKVFKALKSKYPNATPVVLQRADVEMSRIGCQ